MPLGITIDNIAGSVRLAAPAADSLGTPAGKSPSGSAGLGQATAAAGAQAASEPTGQLSPGFSVVVLQVLNDQGAVVSTTPTTQQLAAYRNGTATPPGVTAS